MAKVNNEIAVNVSSVSKAFKIPHEKHNNLKGAALNALKHKTYEQFVALDNVSFNVKKGEFFGIIGRNGSGKSTLLKILAGIYVPDSGQVRINGKLSPFLELGVGFNPELTGRENIYLGGTILGLSRKEIAKKFDKIVQFSELGEFIDMKLKNYSSGMQVRLAFSLSINVHAEILLMDEVLAVGDANFQTKCIEKFKEYKRQGKTVILVTHDTLVVQKYCDRAMLVESGSISKLGAPDEVVSKYMEQNIKRKEIKKIQDKTQIEKNKKAEIEGVFLIDDKNKKTNQIKTGDYLRINIKYKVREKNKKVNIGIGLRTMEGNLVFGYNTIADETNIDNDKREINLIIPSFNVFKGEYFFNAFCCGEEEIDLYDFKNQVQTLLVETKGSEVYSGGIVKFDHSWE